MKGDLGIIEIHHRESQAAEVTERGVNERGGGGLKTQHKYYFHFMGEQPTVGWAAGPESQCQ